MESIVRKINQNHIEKLMDLMNQGPYYQLLSMKLCGVDCGSSRVEVELKREHLNPFGIVHGGAFSSMLDTAAYWSVYCELDEGVGLTTIDLSVNFLAMASEGLLIVEGRSIKVGRSICLAEAYLRNESGKLLAQGTSKLMVLEGKQSPDNAVLALGGNPLPPKFLE